jgi:hypothetical protein
VGAGRNNFFNENSTHEAYIKYWNPDLNNGDGGHSITTYLVEHTAALTLPASIILMSDWNGEIGNFWVLDEDGWAYWAAPLASGDATGLLLSEVTLINEPLGEWYYAIHVNVEIANPSQLPMVWVESGMSLRGEQITNVITGRNNPVAGVPLGGTFIDSNDVVWRVLYRDGDGNRLIMTQYVHGVGTAFNSTNIYTRLQDSDRLRPALNNWFNNVMGENVRSFALPAGNMLTDIRSEPSSLTLTTEVGEVGWTYAGFGAVNAENSLFVLSVSEVNRFNTAGTLNMSATLPDGTGAGTVWWLRSPGGGTGTASRIAVVGTSLTSNNATTANSFRPAVWISQ